MYTTGVFDGRETQCVKLHKPCMTDGDFLLLDKDGGTEEIDEREERDGEMGVWARERK